MNMCKLEIRVCSYNREVLFFLFVWFCFYQKRVKLFDQLGFPKLFFFFFSNLSVKSPCQLEHLRLPPDAKKSTSLFITCCYSQRDMVTGVLGRGSTKVGIQLKFILPTWRSGGFPGGSDGKESACNAGDLGSIPGSGRSLGGGNGYQLQHSCL